jgi:O-antigen chain-terminating methyltransferase
MNATKSPSTEQLLEAIRREAAQLDLSTHPEPEPLQQGAADPQVTTRLPLKPVYHYREFLPFDDETFITNAFYALLHREPDEDGRKSYLDKLRQGVERPQILAELISSEEAQNNEIQIRGLKVYRVLNRLRQSRRLRPAARRVLGLYRRIFELPSPQEMHHFRASVLQQTAQLGAQIQALNEASEVQHLKLSEEKAAGQQHRQEIQTALEGLKQQLANLQFKISYQQQSSTTPSDKRLADTKVAPALEDDTDISAFYVAFEDACRGTREEIREKLTPWLIHLPPAQGSCRRVLDIGCGRGEWMQLLKESGYEPQGVDTNPVMVGACQGLELEAEHADGLSWLMAQPDQSLCAITAFHVIEHMPFADLLRMTNEARRVLIPGGKLIYETPNPENILVGSHTFYHDPTHRNPITPALLEFLAQYCGYAPAELVRLHPYPEEAKVQGNDALTERVNGHLCGPQDIALVATVPTAGEGA